MTRRYYTLSLGLARRIGDLRVQFTALNSLAGAERRLGRFDESAGHFAEALALCRRTGSTVMEAYALNGLGEAAPAAAGFAGALAHLQAAARVAGAIGHRAESARAHSGIGHAHRQVGHTVEARESYRVAIAEFERLGFPEADRLRRYL